MAYKLVKAAAEGIIAVVAVLWTAGIAADLRHVGLLIQAHAIAAWSTALASAEKLRALRCTAAPLRATYGRSEVLL